MNYLKELDNLIDLAEAEIVDIPFNKRTPRHGEFANILTSLLCERECINMVGMGNDTAVIIIEMGMRIRTLLDNPESAGKHDEILQTLEDLDSNDDL